MYEDIERKDIERPDNASIHITHHILSSSEKLGTCNMHWKMGYGRKYSIDLLSISHLGQLGDIEIISQGLLLEMIVVS